MVAVVSAMVKDVLGEGVTTTVRVTLGVSDDVIEERGTPSVPCMYQPTAVGKDVIGTH